MKIEKAIKAFIECTPKVLQVKETGDSKVVSQSKGQISFVLDNDVKPEQHALDVIASQVSAAIDTPVNVFKSTFKGKKQLLTLLFKLDDEPKGEEKNTPVVKETTGIFSTWTPRSVSLPQRFSIEVVLALEADLNSSDLPLEQSQRHIIEEKVLRILERMHIQSYAQGFTARDLNSMKDTPKCTLE